MEWEDRVVNGVKALGERKWKNLARNRQIWQNLVHFCIHLFFVIILTC
jgi:hypothetical protein